ncbi:ROK family transcriptional regulator [Marispirochaeta sp.]|uniref:ROK family transcriptional regulator n=1 Tax=Marispirochaeta sp. TaxID=2038653 RepID=UPI0029C848CC|nr:ROK family transcriptional regulator [Marispirochaeta sp.]
MKYISNLNMNQNLSSKQKSYLSVLNVIHRDHPISRADIGKKIGLTSVTISSIVTQLLEENIIKITGEGDSKGGRRPILVDLVPSAYYMAALDVGITKIIAAIIDWCGNIIRSIRIESDLTNGEEHTIHQMLSQMRKIISEIDPAIQKKIIGIGLSLPGIVDTEKGLSIHSPGTQSLSQEKDVEIAKIFENEFGIKTYIENNARSMALAEIRYGTAQNVPNTCAINIGHGIGSGVSIDGELYRGYALPSGGLGHLMVLPSGPTCYCGGRGCLESLAAGYAIAAAATRSFSMNEGALIRKLVDGRLEKVTAEVVAIAAHKGDPLAKQIIQEAGHYLGMGILSMISFINPEMVVLGGGVTKSGDLLLDGIKQTVNSHSISKRIKLPQILISELGDNSSVIGAAAIALEEILISNPDIFIKKK